MSSSASEFLVGEEEASRFCEPNCDAMVGAAGEGFFGEDGIADSVGRVEGDVEVAGAGPVFGVGVRAGTEVGDVVDEWLGFPLAGDPEAADAGGSSASSGSSESEYKP